MTQPALFQPLTVRGTTFRNRIWVPAMCQYSVIERDGIPTDWHLVNLGAMARGGAGLVISEATAVVAEGRISPHDTGIWNDAQRDAWKRITAFIRSQGAVPGIQLAHAGRKASIYPDWGDALSGKGTAPESAGGWPTVAPSAIAFPGYDDTTELSIAQIDALVVSWTDAAVRAVAAGFEVLESPTAICPIIVHDTAKAIAMSKRLLELGVFVIGFGFPVVPEGHARLRCQVSTAHEKQHLDAFGAALRQLRKEFK